MKQGIASTLMADARRVDVIPYPLYQRASRVDDVLDKVAEIVQCDPRSDAWMTLQRELVEAWGKIGV